jgi:hypothetical protein
MEQIEINVNKTLEEVEINVQPNVTQVIINEVSGGGGVQSVTGNIVDDTDPANPTVDFTAGNYDLEDFTNEGADPFAKISDIPVPVDQDNIPTPVTLYLSDLGLTEFGTDAEMQTALQAYFTANPQAVGEKEIFDFIIEQDPEWNFDITFVDASSIQFGGYDFSTQEGFDLYFDELSNTYSFDYAILNFKNKNNRIYAVIEIENSDFNEFSIFGSTAINVNNVNFLGDFNTCNLDISENEIIIFNTFIPQSVVNLSLLGNQITNFNPTFEAGSNCVDIRLNENNISDWTQTDWVANLPNDGFIDLSDNPVSASGSAVETALLAKGWTVNV